MTIQSAHQHIFQQLRDLLTQDQAFPIPHELMEWLDQRVAGIEIDVHELLAGRQQIAVIWSLSDVQEVRPDLNQNQCWDVLRACRLNHDAELGISWDVLRSQAEALFGAAP